MMKYYAADGQISQSRIEGGIEISAEQYQQALVGIVQGHVVTIDDGFAVCPKPEEPETENPESENPEPPTIEEIADAVRTHRDRLIESVRWRIERNRDEVMLNIEPTEPLEPLLRYTQLLRDVPQQEGFPESFEWPPRP